MNIARTTQSPGGAALFRKPPTFGASLLSQNSRLPQDKVPSASPSLWNRFTQFWEGLFDPQGTDRQLTQVHQQATQAWQDRDWFQFETHLKEALHLFKEHPQLQQKKPDLYIETLRGLGHALRYQYQLEESIGFYQKAVDVCLAGKKKYQKMYLPAIQKYLAGVESLVSQYKKQAQKCPPQEPLAEETLKNLLALPDGQLFNTALAKLDAQKYLQAQTLLQHLLNRNTQAKGPDHFDVTLILDQLFQAERGLDRGGTTTDPLLKSLFKLPSK